jgi:hypothetical protein
MYPFSRSFVDIPRTMSLNVNHLILCYIPDHVRKFGSKFTSDDNEIERHKNGLTKFNREL